MVLGGRTYRSARRGDFVSDLTNRAPAPPTAPGRLTEVVLRPRHESADLALRVSVRGLTDLVEEAVVNWFRVRGFDTWTLYERYRLEFSVIDCSSLIFAAVTAA